VLSDQSRVSDKSSRAVCMARHAGFYCLLTSFALALGSSTVIAQELEPRSYSAVPVGTNFVVATYARSTGDILFDPSLPVTNLHAGINTYSLGYSHSFGLFDHVASIAFLEPYANANVTGIVEGAPGHVYRSDAGDVHFRFAIDLLGAPALDPAEFSRRSPSTIVGVSLSAIAPSGQYVPSRLINVGANRWSFKPEIGVSHPMGNWFVEGAAGIWLFTDNPDYFGHRDRSQDPLPVFQWHVGYNWRPGLWIAADATYFLGGQTSVNGVPDHDLQRNIRYGLTLSFPITAQWSGKLAWSRGLTTTIGGDFQTVSVALQYRWFNH
jgi:Putative MetA-pathway of phenol degradation